MAGVRLEPDIVSYSGAVSACEKAAPLAACTRAPRARAPRRPGARRSQLQRCHQCLWKRRPVAAGAWAPHMRPPRRPGVRHSQLRRRRQRLREGRPEGLLRFAASCWCWPHARSCKRCGTCWRRISSNCSGHHGFPRNDISLLAQKAAFRRCHAGLAGHAERAGGVRHDPLQRSHQRVQEVQGVTSGSCGASGDAGCQAGRQHHRLQRCHQCMREVCAIALNS